MNMSNFAHDTEVKTWLENTILVDRVSEWVGRLVEMLSDWSWYKS